ncbi:XAP5, circadian clock regulator-domain-containing protein [Obelidium mucronatum]|nr:XAP5, circadian clock regulator-domain-containing protein [Obelidium mucronatum]
MATQKGTDAEGQRAMALEKQREQMMDDFKKQKDQIKKDNEVRIGADKFVAQVDSIQSDLIKHTVGLVRLEDFQKIKETLHKKRQEEIERGLASSGTVKTKKRKDKTQKGKLSFGFDEEEQKDDEDAEKEETPAEKKLKVKKNPHVDTSFLPDKEREERERRERELLKLEWLKQQDLIKEERINITYSYWDGSGHRTSVEVKKGNTIGQFLEACKAQWDELRGVNVDNLVYIKEDLIIPHHYTFYDFIINKVRGKSGPLFAFDVHDDVRLVNDATVETEESHAGKVVQRGWYEKNKHIFPASRWEVFDPSKVFEKYTVKDLTKGNK